MRQVISIVAFIFAPLWQAKTAYNPERHYMRGPGPKWHEKHARAKQAEARLDDRSQVLSSR